MKPPLTHQSKAAETTHSASHHSPVAQPTVLQATIDELTTRLSQASQDRLRALADYQNLQRRTADDRQKMVKLATQSLVEDLLEPFDHLSMAAAHLQDKALVMIVEQLWKTLAEHGLTELDVLGKPFDPQMMEVVEHTAAEQAKVKDNSEHSPAKPATKEVKVTQVIHRGYALNGVILRVAKVAVA